MLCDTCRWSGRPGFVRRAQARGGDRTEMIPCPDCGGSGVAHCCDGICAQPDLGAPGQPPSPARDLSAADETMR